MRFLGGCSYHPIELGGEMRLLMSGLGIDRCPPVSTMYCEIHQYCLRYRLVALSVDLSPSQNNAIGKAKLRAIQERYDFTKKDRGLPVRQRRRVNPTTTSNADTRMTWVQSTRPHAPMRR
jgi:hypothetical protein